jgi:hypothetical protein
MGTIALLDSSMRPNLPELKYPALKLLSGVPTDRLGSAGTMDWYTIGPMTPSGPV